MTATTHSLASLGHHFTLLALPLSISSPFSASPPAAANPCDKSAYEMHQSCRREANADYWKSKAFCSNLPSNLRAACLADAQDQLEEDLDLCDDQYDERLEVCDDLGGGIYHPTVNPANFVSGVTHPYMTWTPGVTHVYEKVTSEGLERIEVTTTSNTRTILGVVCVEVHDVVTLDGVPVEDTLDWYAQDLAGNVWYFGELALNFEGGVVTDIDGSWTGGVDGAKVGIVMQAAPKVGDLYRQEFFLGEAEDLAEVLHLSAPAVVPYGSFPNCLKTEEFTPIDPEVEEFKFYAPGVGMVLEINPETGERLELIDIR